MNGEPAIAAFARHVNTIGDANWPEDATTDNPWTWAGDSGKPVELRGQPGGGLMNGLKMAFVAGENTFMLYHREGNLNPQTMCTDMFMISSVDFVPTDADLQQISLAVEPTGKLARVWAELKAGD